MSRYSSKGYKDCSGRSLSHGGRHDGAHSSHHTRGQGYYGNESNIRGVTGSSSYYPSDQQTSFMTTSSRSNDYPPGHPESLQGRWMEHGAGPTNLSYVQDLETLHRSAQASTQMLYDVFDYTIGMLEELEKHEKHKEKPANSGILSHLIPQQRKKPADEVCTGIEVELQCLSVQMRYLSPEIIKNSKEKMVHQTLLWAASRDGLPFGPVDHYCRNVLEVLLFGKHLVLPERDRTEIEATEEDVNNAMHQVAAGRIEGAKQDEEFHKDSKKKAKLHKKRDEGRNTLLAGARRLVPESDKYKELWQALDEYLPDDAMEIL